MGVPPQTVPRQTLADSFRRNLSRPGLATQHICSNFRIRVAGERATCVSQWVGHHFLAGAAGGEEFTLRAEYTDELLLANGRWLINSLQLRLWYTTGNPQLLAS